MLAVLVTLTTGCASQQSLDSSGTQNGQANDHKSGKKQSISALDNRKPLKHFTAKKRQNSHPSAKTLSSQAPQQDPNDLWWLVTENLAFSKDVPDRLVGDQLEWLDGNQRYFENTLQRAQLYLPYVLDQVLDADLPAEVALLPFIESAYNPFAYSHSGAAGLWQFIPSTAEGFGLEQNRWYEGRKDVVASTEAAITYISHLNNIFEGDWLLTFAAYNGGPGTVKRAIEANEQKGKPTDYWSLQLSEETTNYVPRLIALSKVIAEAENYSVELTPIDLEIPFAKVELEKPIDLSQAATIANISSDELYHLNPGYTRWVTPPAGPHYLLLPTSEADSFKEKLAELPARQWRPQQEYVVKKGDTLGKIARAQGMSAKDLATINGIRTDTVIRIGQVLRYPTNPLADSRLDLATLKPATYSVVAGDSLWSIAKRYKLTLDELTALNGLSKDAVLKPGQEILVSQSQAATNSEAARYRVQKGDSLYIIARRFDVALNDLLSWNNLVKTSVLQPGQQLKVGQH